MYPRNDTSSKGIKIAAIVKVISRHLIAKKCRNDGNSITKDTRNANVQIMETVAGTKKLASKVA